MLPVLILMDIMLIRRVLRHVNMATLRQIIPGAFLGIALGGWFIGSLTDTLLELLLGAMSLLFAFWQRLAGWFAKMPGSALFWGGASGLSSTLIHAGGPPINVYFLGRELPKLTWVATSACFFGVMNIVKVIPYGLNQQFEWPLLALSLALAPFAWIGIWAGHHMLHRLSEQTFVSACRALLAISGGLLCYKALT